MTKPKRSEIEKGGTRSRAEGAEESEGSTFPRCQKQRLQSSR